jgi:hypothetical protein
MAQAYLLFDFKDEDSAQRARHKVEGWKQGFRLDRKMILKFDRQEAQAGEEGDKEAAEESAKQKNEEKNQRVRAIVRLDFSEHEKLSYQRWIDRIPGEEEFKEAQPRLLKSEDAEYEAMAERFESLD